MAILHYVEIENFKTFSNRIRIELNHPAVIIGPNNSGKTSVIQALSLWDRGVKSWYEKKGDTNSTHERERYGAGINRLNMLEVPVGETRFFWNKTQVRQKSENVKLRINIGIEFKGEIVDCPFVFTYRDAEVIYSTPDARTVPKGKEPETLIEMQKDLQKKRETIYDGSDLFYQTDKIDGYSDGGVYNGQSLKIGFGGKGLPYGEKDYLAKDWDVYG
jgi:hypothetical protein